MIISFHNKKEDMKKQYIRPTLVVSQILTTNLICTSLPKILDEQGGSGQFAPEFDNIDVNFE